jgi:integrase
MTNTEAVTKYVEQYTQSNNYRNTILRRYAQFLRFLKKEVKVKSYSTDAKEIRCPTHEKLEMIISNAGKTMSLKLQLSLETGLRPVELIGLKAKDIDTDQRIVYPTTAKHGAPRKIQIPNTLNMRLRQYIIKNDIQPNQQIFKGDEVRYGKEYREIRNRLAKKLSDPSIQTIRLYDFRHYFGTMTFNKTRNIKVTQYLTGHKHSNTTDIYTHLINVNDDEWICNTAQTIAESKQLIEAGFEYVTEQDGLKLYRKRK